jgi:PAS domain S-box-containing protein
MDWMMYIEDILQKVINADKDTRSKLIKELSDKLAECEKYKSYLENASDTIAEMDESGTVIYTTNNWIRQLGYDPEDIKGKAIFHQFFHPDDAPKAEEYLQKAYKTKKTQTGFEYRIKNIDGQYRWHSANLSPVLDDRGKVSSVVAIAHSIHDRKMAELQLTERETLYRLLLNTMQEAVIMVDNNDIIKYVNPRCCQLFDVSPDEVIGKIGYESFIIPEDQQIIQNQNRKRTQGLPDEYTVRGCKKDGSIIWLKINGSPLYDEQGKAMGSVGIMTDITESKKAMDALKRSEEKFRDLFDNSMAGVFQSSMQDRYLNVNKRFATMFGYDSPEEMINSVTDIKKLYVNPDERENLKELLIRDGMVSNYEVELYRKDGSRFWTSLAARYRVSEEGVSVMEGANIDITESKNLREQLLSGQKMEAIGKLAAGVAHDFNNLLTLILGYSEDIVEELPPNSPVRESADEIVKAGLRAATLTRELLTFSKKQAVRCQDLDFNSLLNNLKSIFVRILGDEITLNYHLADNIGVVKADSTQMEQVLVNLVLNAREAMAPGGILRIKTRNEKKDSNRHLRQLDSPAEEYVHLVVSDTGMGIDKKNKHKIFEPFFTTKSDARGLGLSTVWGTVQQYGGIVYAESEAGKGCEMHILLPANAAEQDIRPLSLGKADKGKEESILVVEDEIELCRLIKKMLSNLGYKVMATTKAREALDHFHNNHVPDLLLTDVMMPGMNGMQLIEAVKKLHPRQKILVMSGYTDDIVSDHGLLGNIIPFIPKPFTASQINPIIRQILDQ